jgi:hypothetical protein
MAIGEVRGILVTMGPLQIVCEESTGHLIMFILEVYIWSHLIGLVLTVHAIPIGELPTSISREKSIEREFMYGVITILRVGDSGGGTMALPTRKPSKSTPVTATIRTQRPT